MTTEAKKLLAALWRDQTARHPEPPTPALVDAYYELELPLAPRLHWCRENRVVPAEQTEMVTYRKDRTIYNWYPVVQQFRHPLYRMLELLQTRQYHATAFWSRTLRGAYEKLLIVPLEAFQ